MDSQQIIAELETERARIDQALLALRGNLNRTRTVNRGHNVATGQRRKLSSASKRRISLMMKKRWAERKAKLKVVAGKKAA